MWIMLTPISPAWDADKRRSMCAQASGGSGETEKCVLRTVQQIKATMWVLPKTFLKAWPLFFQLDCSLFSPPLLPPSPFILLACGPKTLLRHLRLKRSSGQIFQLTLAKASVLHPHTPQFCLARFRYSVWGDLTSRTAVTSPRWWRGLRPLLSLELTTALHTSLSIPFRPY